MPRFLLTAMHIAVYVALLLSFVLMFLPFLPEEALPVSVPTKRSDYGTQTSSLKRHSSRNILKNRSDKQEALDISNVLGLSQKAARETYMKRYAYRYVPLASRMKQLGVASGVPVYLRIFKTESILEVWVEKNGRYEHLKDYEICAWSGRLGPKLKEGDRQSPEGFYKVYRSSLNPHSRFHLSFNLGFPNAYDRAHGRTGSYLMVHGDCRSIGCYAMTDRNIDEIYALVQKALEHGQPYVPVHIFPFRLDDTTIAAYEGNRWFDFWMNLKEGYDYFEAERRPPRIEVRHGRYVVKEE
jgi:murein L,D-transpeptidase YafK